MNYSITKNAKTEIRQNYEKKKESNIRSKSEF